MKLPDTILVEDQKLVTTYAERQRVAMDYAYDNLIGDSPAMQQLRQTIARVADSEVPILITGATGTGKELAARIIHFHSNRRRGPLVELDCTDSQITIETIADQIARAKGGTLLIQEAADLPWSLQSGLFDLLQESGLGTTPESEAYADGFRTITTTSRELTTRVSTRSFRENLYYRLAMVPLHLPHLTHRREDIDLLTEYFLRRIRANTNTESWTISAEAMESLRQHNWPGNIDELEEMLASAVTASSGCHLDESDLAPLLPPRQPGSSEKRSLQLRQGSLDAQQRNSIVKSLDLHDWNFTRTAADLGIGRTTLWRKIKKYNLKRETCPS